MAANLKSTEELMRLRQAMVNFIDRAGRAVDAGCRSLQNGYAWLREQQIPLLEREARQAEMRLGEAKVAYNSAKLSVRMEQKASFEDEERELHKAKARFDICEEALRRGKDWMRRLEKEGQAHLVPIRQFGRRIEDMRERGVGELDRKISEVATYLGKAGGDVS